MTPVVFARWVPKVNFGAADECWEWAAARTAGGYGTLSDGSRTQLTHRLVYEHFVGPIPDGLQIDHLCRNRCCCNPAHLEAVTSRENARRGIGLTLRSHCVDGHEYTPQNTKYYPSKPTVRVCRVCETAHNAVRRARRASSRPKLTAEQVRQIRTLYAAGAKPVRIAEGFGICRGHVHRIVSKRVWRHLRDAA